MINTHIHTSTTKTSRPRERKNKKKKTKIHTVSPNLLLKKQMTSPSLFVSPSQSPLAPRNNIQQFNPVDDNTAMLPSSVPPRQKDNTYLSSSHQPFPHSTASSYSYSSVANNPPKPLGDEEDSGEATAMGAATDTTPFGKLRGGGGDSKKLQKKEENDKGSDQSPAPTKEDTATKEVGIKGKDSSAKNDHHTAFANSKLANPTRAPNAKNNHNGKKKKVVDLSKLKYITYVTTKSKHVLIEVIPSKIPNYEDPAVAAHFPNSLKRMCEYLYVPFPSWTNTEEPKSVVKKKGIGKSSNESFSAAKAAEKKPLQQQQEQQHSLHFGGDAIDESVPASGLRYAASKVELNKSIRNALSLNNILTPSDVAELIVLSSSSLTSEKKRKLREQYGSAAVSTNSEELEKEKVFHQKRLLEALLSATTEHTASPSASGGTTPSKSGRSRTSSLLMNAVNPPAGTDEQNNVGGAIRAKMGDLANTAEAVVDNIDTLEDFTYAAKFILGRVANKASSSFRSLKDSVVLFKNATDETGFSSVERHGGGRAVHGEESDRESSSSSGDGEERCLPASHNNDDNEYDNEETHEEQQLAAEDDEGDESGSTFHEGQRLLRVRVVNKYNVTYNNSTPPTMAAETVEDSTSSGKVKKSSSNDLALRVKKATTTTTSNIKNVSSSSASAKDEDLSFFTFAFENRFRFPHLWRRLHVLRIMKQRHFNAVFLKYKWLTQSKREVPIVLHGLCFYNGSWQLRRKLNLDIDASTAAKSGSKNNSFASNITTAKVIQIPKDTVNRKEKEQESSLRGRGVEDHDGGKRESESLNKDNKDESDRLLEILNNINKKKVNSLLLLDHKVHQPSAASSSASSRFLKSDSSTSFSKRGVNLYGTASSSVARNNSYLRDNEEIDEIQKQQAGGRIIGEGQRAQEMLLPSAALMEILHEHRKKNDLFTDASLLHVNVREGGEKRLLLADGGGRYAPSSAPSAATAEKSVFTTPFSFFSQLFGRDTAQNNIEAMRQQQSQQHGVLEKKELALLYQSLPKILRNTAMCDLAVAKAFGSLYGKGVGTDDLRRFHEQVWPMRVLRGKYGIQRGGSGGLERSSSSGVFVRKISSFASSSSTSDDSHGPTPTKAKSRLITHPAAQTATTSEQQQVEPSHVPHHTTINIPVWGGGYLISEYHEAESARQREELELQQMAAEARRNSLRLERKLKLSEKDVDRSIKIEAVRDKVLAMSMNTDNDNKKNADSDGVEYSQERTEKALLQQQQHLGHDSNDNHKSSNYDSLQEHKKEDNILAKKMSSSVLMSRHEERRLRESAIMEKDSAEEAGERRKMAAAEKVKRLILTELRHNMSFDEVPVGRRELLRAKPGDDEKEEGEEREKEPNSGLLNLETHIDPHSGQQPLQQARRRLSQSSTSSADPLLVASVSHEGEEESRIDRGQDERVASPS